LPCRRATMLPVPILRRPVVEFLAQSLLQLSEVKWVAGADLSHGE